MANVFVNEQTLKDIADAIRTKNGSSDTYFPGEMPEAIKAIQSSSGGDYNITSILNEDGTQELAIVDVKGGLPEDALTISGSLYYRFYGSGWNWFIEYYNDSIITSDITNLSYSFYNNNITKIPFVLNVNNISNLSYAFYQAKLTECPKIRGTLSITASFTASYMITGCNSLRNVDDLLTSEMLNDYSLFKVTSSFSIPDAPNFMNCFSLRKIPGWFYQLKLNPESTVFPNSSYCLYYRLLEKCTSLDEAPNIPVWMCEGEQTSDMFYRTVAGTCRLKDFTFETNNGEAIVTKWKSQVIDFSSNVGYAPGYYDYIINYNSGITSDKYVTDTAQNYQALKNDPDWFTADYNYSRYNHNSAVNTINSLPDTSAYLETAGGTNTIKFKGDSGALTDGGAINTLTAEEIAVATAKGWTVTLV